MAPCTGTRSILSYDSMTSTSSPSTHLPRQLVWHLLSNRTIHLRERVASVHSEVNTVDVFAVLREQENNRTHQVARITHLTHGNQRDPFLLELWVLVEYLCSPTVEAMSEVNLFNHFPKSLTVQSSCIQGSDS